MLSGPKLPSIRLSIGQAIKLSSAITLLTLSSATVARAQFDSGQISGFVRESSKATIANATVTATNQAQAETAQVKRTVDSRQIQDLTLNV
jgi:hypothetical protein